MTIGRTFLTFFLYSQSQKKLFLVAVVVDGCCRLGNVMGNSRATGKREYKKRGERPVFTVPAFRSFNYFSRKFFSATQNVCPVPVIALVSPAHISKPLILKKSRLHLAFLYFYISPPLVPSDQPFRSSL